jgi:antitoxin (DNA-binding transcriptional repressor) of toxin-antitoxin stability system
MEVFTLQEWEDNFDELFERVESGETIGIIGDDGKAAVFMPIAEAEFLRIHTTDNNDAQ